MQESLKMEEAYDLLDTIENKATGLGFFKDIKTINTVSTIRQKLKDSATDKNTISNHKQIIYEHTQTISDLAWKNKLAVGLSFVLLVGLIIAIVSPEKLSENSSWLFLKISSVMGGKEPACEAFGKSMEKICTSVTHKM